MLSLQIRCSYVTALNYSKDHTVCVDSTPPYTVQNNNGGESRYAPKGEYRRYSGLVPDYTSTKTSYSVVAPRLKGIILYHEAYRKSRILRCIFNTFRILDENNLFQNKKYLILRTDFRILCVIFIAIFFFMCYNKSEHICAFSVREFYD